MTWNIVKIGTAEPEMKHSKNISRGHQFEDDAIATDLVFRGRKIRLMFVRFLISGWAGQLSIRRATFLLWARKDESSSVIQLFFFSLYRQGSCFRFLKHRGFLDLLITNISNFSPVVIAAAMPVNLTLPFLPPEHFSLDRW